jgi:predicted hydrolase (HD superfamily)
MHLPTKETATTLLHQHVTDEYQRLHALMVATAMEGYALHFAAASTQGSPAAQLAHMQHSTPAFGTTAPMPIPSIQADPLLWYVTGLLHDIDFQEHADAHPAPSLQWFKDWGYPGSLIHAVEAHAYGYHGFTTKPETPLAAALVACDELTGIFYAYRKMNPVRYGEMKAASIKKKFKDPGFAAKIDRSTIQLGCDKLGVLLDDHIANLIRFLAPLD